MYISFLKLKPYDQWKFYLKQNKISGNFFQRGILDLVFLNVNHMKVSFPIKKKKISEISCKNYSRRLSNSKVNLMLDVQMLGDDKPVTY
jgi:hypothetical protein